MRLFVCICLLFVAVPTTSLAQQSTTPGYTAFDQQQFAKLRAGVGTWNCTDIPASKVPDIVTTTQEGNWFVSRETGDNPNTSYTRWSHGYQHYFTMSMGPQGDASMSVTTSRDPYNGTWTIAAPATSPNGKPNPPFNVSLKGDTMVSWGDYYDNKNNLVHFKSTCVKSG